jgi:zinc transporter ZupT
MMDIRIRAFGKMLSYLAIVFVCVFILNWLLPQYSLLAMLSICAGMILYSVYALILTEMETKEKLQELEK